VHGGGPEQLLQTTPKAKELYETMAREMPFDPRKEHDS
jgi:hypothetical protein